MISLARIAKDFSRAAARYDAHADLQREVLQEAVVALAPHLHASASVLDVGCGTGALVEFAPGSWRLQGCDIAPGMVRYAAKHYSAQLADMCALPYAEGRMDGVMCSLVMQWQQDMPAALREMFRVVRPGGAACITTFGPQTLQELRGLSPQVHPFRSLEEITQAAGQAGWRVHSTVTRHERRSYATPRALMEQIRQIGAQYKLPERRGLLTPRKLRALETQYQARYAHGSGVYASWEIYRVVLQK